MSTASTGIAASANVDGSGTGGGVCALAAPVRERYRRLAEEEYRRHALDGFRNLDRLEFSVCGDEAPVVGALAWAMS